MVGTVGENIGALIFGILIICGMIYFPYLLLKFISYDPHVSVDIDEADGTSYVTLPNGDRRLDDTEGGY